jgi:hypothetical protein
VLITFHSFAGEMIMFFALSIRFITVSLEN